MTASVDRPGLCEECGAARARGQRYCLSCGARVGVRSALLAELLGRERARREAIRPDVDPGGGGSGGGGSGSGGGWEGQAAGAVAAGGGGGHVAGAVAAGGGEGSAAARENGARAPWGSGLSLPSRRVCSVLVLAFLGFGILIGNVVASPVQSTLSASAERHVQLVLPASPAPSTSSPSSESGGTGESSSPSSSPSSSSNESSSEPPSASSEPTPPAPASTSPKSGSGKSNSTRSPGTGKAGKGGSEESGSPSGGASSKLPPVKHVFVIMLSNQPYASVFGPSSPSSYLSNTLEHQGELLVRYYAVAHQGLADGIALISGQGPTAETAANCPTYTAIAPTPTTEGADEQVLGTGCVYPASTQTLPGQLTAKHDPWRAYIEGMDEGSTGSGGSGGSGGSSGSGGGAGVGGGGADGACGHPALGSADPTSSATPAAGQTYATWRNPFVYFTSITSAPACEAQDVGLKELAGDLTTPSRTPSFAYIVPDLCHDGSPTPCAPGAPAGLPAAEGFLKKVIPQIMGSRAYKESGLLVITVDQAPSSGPFEDSSSCCGQPQFPNLPPPTSPLGPPGGGQVGALLLSPFIHGGGVSQTEYNHFSLLRTIEDFFGLSHLGYAALPKVSSFEPAIFTRSK